MSVVAPPGWTCRRVLLYGTMPSFRAEIPATENVVFVRVVSAIPPSGVSVFQIDGFDDKEYVYGSITAAYNYFHRAAEQPLVFPVAPYNPRRVTSLTVRGYDFTQGIPTTNEMGAVLEAELWSHH